MSTSHVPNPMAYAQEEFNVAINTHGDFSWVRFGRQLDRLRVRLQAGTDMRLVRRLTDLEGSVTSLFECQSTGALVLVRETHLCEIDECEMDFGDVAVSATSHESLTSTLTLLESEGDADDFLEWINPGGEASGGHG